MSSVVLFLLLKGNILKVTELHTLYSKFWYELVNCWFDFSPFSTLPVSIDFLDFFLMFGPSNVLVYPLIDVLEKYAFDELVVNVISP